MNCQYAHLESDALLHIVGPDTLKFLQGQTSCDTRTVDAMHAIPGVFCTPKGRVLCDFLLCELNPDHFALRLRRDIRASSSAAFGKYIVFSNAELNAARDDWTLLGVWGPDAAKCLAKIFGDLPSERFAATSGEGYTLVQTDEKGQEFECYLDAQICKRHLTEMAQGIEKGTDAEWQTRQICAGIARIEATTVEEFVPQTLNYDLTGHISFNKGCYTGQEVVARLHYRGTPKRRTYAAELSDTAGANQGGVLASGSALFSSETGLNVGTIVNSSAAGDKTLLLIAATTSGAAEGLHVGANNGPLLTLLELPYALDAR
ncbi:MAG: hypothetical protein P8J17_01425 [Halioglobus sp.]|nr:hypothetical protein [Halioglobus sp.]